MYAVLTLVKRLSLQKTPLVTVLFSHTKHLNTPGGGGKPLPKAMCNFVNRSPLPSPLSLFLSCSVSLFLSLSLSLSYFLSLFFSLDWAFFGFGQPKKEKWPFCCS